ncbi:MAG TPA: error-prone DNA polymerase [Thermomicrobiales bacterium]|nr:error-prone DNA polymerase [Thermomicrobiales bacterium]
MAYTELHLHTAFSFLDGASLPEEMIAQAVADGYTALAVTDHDGLYGAMEFAQTAKAAGITPITGAEITLDDGSHLTLLVETRAGYGNLCRLLTDSKHGRPPAAISLPSSHPGGEDATSSAPLTTSHLADYAEGLILLTGCRQGQLARAIDEGRLRDAETVLRTYIDWFGPNNVVVELQQNFVFGDTPRIRHLVKLADRLGVRYAATGNVHYHRQDRHRLQDVLVAIANRATLDTSHRERRPNAQFHLRTPEEMAALFADYPDAIRTTEIVAERCASFDLTRDLQYQFPTYETGTGESADDLLARICREAFADRYKDPADPRIDRAHSQLQDELRLIRKHGLAGFFLLYHDLLNLAKDVAAEIRGREATGSRIFLPPGRGRGSAVSSIVCYLIGLSPVDPLRHELYVGRFLNEELPSVPDIDLDFPREIRERMIERVYEVYGADRVALVCAFATYRLRSAVRDVGKTLGLPLADLDRIAKLSEPRSADGLGDELDRLPEYAARKNAPPWSHLIEIAKQLAGFPRHVTQHVGGMVISATPLNELIPIQPAAMDGRYICHWDKDSCEDARLIKIDFLALGMLSLVEECLDLIDASGQSPINLSRIDFDDPAVYDMIQEGDTIGVFQVESRAQIQMIRRTKPEKLDDLVVQVAIVRPGPIVGGAVTPFVERRTNPAFRPAYDHPRLKPILRDTLGVILYQEQVVQVAEAIAGFTAGQADQLRRAMTRKRSHEAMEAMRAQFMAGAANQKVKPELASQIFDKLAGFAEYGFPKSHAAAFAFLAYQSCWLKRYHPAEFLCALLNNQPMGFYAPHVLINDAKRHGLRVLKPDVNDSELECTVEGRHTVRVGLSFVKGLSEDAAVRIVRERRARGDYRSLADLVRRVALRPDTQQNLIAAGACDGFGLQRREMLWQIGLFVSPKGFRDKRTRRYRGQQLPLPLPTAQDHVDLPRTTSWDRMTDEYRVLGLSVLHHPLGLLRNRLPKGMSSSQELATLPDGMTVWLPGLVVCRQRPATAGGITFLLMEDEFDLVNVIVYPDLYEKQRLHVRSTPLLIVRGRLQLANNNINIVAEHLQPIEESHIISAPPAWGERPILSDDINPAHMQLVQLPSRDLLETPLTRADIRAVTPDSHNYR